MPDYVLLRVKRQDGPNQRPYWQTFRVRYLPQMNVITCLQEIAANPVTIDGHKTSAVAWDCCCLEEVCGACTMVINGRVRQACSALVDDLLEENRSQITLEPMSKFPLVRDLLVDRSRMFEALMRVKAWVPVEGYYDLGEGPKLSAKDQQEAYHYSRCMTCGCCVEACPQYTPNNAFVGAAAIAQTILFNMHQTGKTLEDDRLEALMQPGGISDCGQAQNCERVCPKEIPLTTAIAKAYRQVTVQAIKKLFSS